MLACARGARPHARLDVGMRARPIGPGLRGSGWGFLVMPTVMPTLGPTAGATVGATAKRARARRLARLAGRCLAYGMAGAALAQPAVPPGQGDLTAPGSGQPATPPGTDP